MTPSGDNKEPKRPRRGTTARGRSSAQPDPEAGTGERGILSNLPSTRPQRPSARRAAAKRAAAKRSDPGPAAPSAATRTAEPAAKPTGPGTSTKSTERRATAKRARPVPTGHRTAPPAVPSREPPVPPQGFEGEDEIEPGTPVQPPSRPEVAGALAELIGELAQTGLARGGRMVKEALGRLPGI